MELAKSYDPSAVEERRYAEWKQRGLFRATPGQGKPYCITIPPPNVTSNLHIGHALNGAILDVLTRRHRMMGDNTLCLPGTDHAGIATQNVVERNLAREGVTRHDLGREAFIQKCWEWRALYGGTIYSQLEKLGCSYDWDRARFTMDETYVAAIYEEFLRWWERGLIYRGSRVVNWCPRCRSAISDIEVDSEERGGKLYHFRYPFAAGAGHVTIATTRPETLLGDAAVAVNPDDERYMTMHGRKLTLPLTGREIPLIADAYARMDFGTGAVKVTPAHDLDDFEAGLRNNLPQIVVIGEDGAMTAAAGPRYAGMDRFECRERVLADLEELGLVDRIEDYTVKIPMCDRCKTVLEPLLSEQWFVKMKPLAQPAIDVVRDGSVRFIPERYGRIYLDWMENIRDWCISRQLWWGHRIPVWWTADGRYAAARSAADAAAQLGEPVEALRQDEDVLDTWFSSALWPQATLGWPAETEDLKFWYPTNVLSTAQEILYLWVARMVMTGMDFLGQIPFHEVYVHATVLDEHGDRMSKSKGNGIDPVEMIGKYGADALRFSLLQQTGMNQDIKFSEERVRLAGQFCNKLWNASRFVMLNLEGADVQPIAGLAAAGALEAPDRWILSRLERTIDTVQQGVDSFNLDDAARAIYSFLWDDFCDWYVEIAKQRLRDEGPARTTAQSVLYHVLETTLRLMHPMTPFITEEIWQALTDGRRPADASIMNAACPEHDPAMLDPAAEEEIALVVEATRAIRNLRAEIGLPPASRIAGAAAAVGDPADALARAEATIRALARLSEFSIDHAPPSGTGKWVSTPIACAEVFLEIGDALDVPRELERIDGEVAKIERDLERSRARLENPQFVERAPADVVDKERQIGASLVERREKLLNRRRMLAG